MEHDTGSGADPAAEPAGPAESAGPAEAEEATAVAQTPPTGEPPATGEPRVDAAVSRLGELDELPLSEHPGVYERIHEELVEVLGELHSAQAPAAQGSAEQDAG
jgi:hypothetical protein